MARVLRTSYVRELMERKGWKLTHSTGDTVFFVDNADRLVAIPLHPTRPDLIRLADLTPRVPVLRWEFSNSAFEELPAEDAYLDVLIMRGSADDADIQALFDALSDLNVALGGKGLTFEREAVLV